MGRRLKASETAASNPGNQTLRLITPELIGAELRRAHVVTGSGPVHLEMVPGNPNRRDFATRVNFRVFRARRPVCYLTIGRSLDDFWERTKAFAKACPEIACRPLFHRKTPDWDLAGVEYFEGETLEAQVLGGSLNAAEAVVIADNVVQALNRTFRASHIEAAAREFDQFAARVVECPLFGGLDQGFLREVIIPFVRAGALSGPQRTRWTNGDFIPRNVLTDGQGNLRLIDYEFAGRTHFWGEDAWRWRTFSSFPEEARDVPVLRDALPRGEWVEMFFLLRQLTLLHEINGAHLAVAEAPYRVGRLMELITAAHAGFRASVFYGRAAGFAPRAEAPGREACRAQLFWSANDTFEEKNSKRAEFAAKQDVPVRFTLNAAQGRLRLRFDPVDTVGLIQISALRIREAKTSAPLLALTAGGDWDRVQVAGGLIRLADSPELNLLSTDTDPILLLPEIEVGDGPSDLTFEVWLRFTPELRTLADLLRTGPVATLPDDGRTQQIQARLTEAESSRDHLAKSIEEAHRELGLKAAEISNVLTRMAALDDALDDRQRELENRDAAIAQLQHTGVESAAQLQARADELANLTARLADVEHRLHNEWVARNETAAKLDQAQRQSAELQEALTARQQDLAQRDESIAQLHQAGERAQAEALARQQELTALAEKFADTEARLHNEWAARNETAVRLEQAKQQAAELQTALDERQQDVAARDASLVQLREALAAAEAQAQARADEISGLTEQLAATEARARDEAASGQATAARLEESAQEVAALQQVLAARDTHIAELEKRVAELGTELGARSSELTASAAQLAERESELHTATQELAARDALIANLQQQETEAAAQLQARTNDITDLTTRLAGREAEFQAATARLATLGEEHTAAQARVADLESSLATRDREIAELRSTTADLTAERDRVRADAAALAQRVAQVTQESADRKRVLEERERTLAERDTTIARLEKEQSAAAAQLQARTTELTALAHRCARLESALQAEKARVAETAAQRDAAEKRAGTLDSTVAEREATIARLEKSATEAAAALAEKGRVIEQLRDEVAARDARLATKETERLQLVSQLGLLEQKANGLRSALDERERELAARDQAITRLKQTAQETATLLEARDAEVARLAARLGHLETRLQTEVHDHQVTTTALGTAKKRIAELVAQCDAEVAARQQTESVLAETRTRHEHEQQRAEAALAGVRADVERLEAALAQADMRAATLSGRLEATVTRATELEQLWENAKGRITTLETELAGARDDAAMQADAVARLSQNLEAARGEISSLHGEKRVALEALAEQSRLFEAESTRIEAELRSRDVKLEAAHEAIQRGHDAIQRANQTSEELRAQVAATRSEADTLQNDVDRLNTELSDTQRKLVTTREALAAAQETNDADRTHLAAQAGQIDQLSADLARAHHRVETLEQTWSPVLKRGLRKVFSRSDDSPE